MLSFRLQTRAYPIPRGLNFITQLRNHLCRLHNSSTLSDIMTRRRNPQCTYSWYGTWMLYKTACFTFRQSHMRLVWILRLILQMRSVEKTPNLLLLHRQVTYIEDLNEAGGVYAVMNELNRRTCYVMTVTGKTWQERAIAGWE